MMHDGAEQHSLVMDRSAHQIMQQHHDVDTFNDALNDYDLVQTPREENSNKIPLKTSLTTRMQMPRTVSGMDE